MSFNVALEIENYFRIIVLESININSDDSYDNDEKKNEIVALINTIAISFSKFARNRYVVKDQILFENIDVDLLEMHEFIEDFHEQKKYVKKFVDLMNILNQR